MTEGIPLNIAQQLFLVLFSILYGVMLQSIAGFQPFPLARIRKGYIQRDGKPETDFEHCEGKNNKQLVRMWRKRVALSIFFLNILPLLYFFGFLHGLSAVPISQDFPSSDLVLVGVIFWSALGVFGFYRVYHAIAVEYWKDLFCDVIEKRFEDNGISFDPKAHLLWGLLFYILPPLHFLLLLNFPTLLGTLGIYPTLFLVWLICVLDC